MTVKGIKIKKSDLSIILTLLIVLHIYLVMFLGISFIGFWTDIIFITLLFYGSVNSIKYIKNKKLKFVVLSINILISLVIAFSCMLFVFFNNPIHDENFYFIQSDDRYFNAYISPPQGFPPHNYTLAINEVLIIPILEKRKFDDTRAIELELIIVENHATKEEKINLITKRIQSEIINKNK